jgi:hypothetical protein
MMVKKKAKELFEIDEETKEKWQSIIDLMARIIDVPAGLIMQLVGYDISVFISSNTDNNPYKPGEKEHFKDSGLYCETVINTNKSLLVPNALRIEQWKNNPDIKLNMISYLGFPILFPDKQPFGTICVLDNKENKYSGDYVELVKNFRDIIEKDLSLLYMNYSLGEKNRKLNEYIAEIKTLRGIIPICANCKKIRDDKGYWQQLEKYFENYSDIHFTHGLCEKCAKELYSFEE